MFKLEIKTDNAAFEDENSEISRILRWVIDGLARGKTEGKCVDSNGNTVGQWSLTED